MSKILITGSSSGLGLMTAQWLAERGHDVVIHARDASRAKAASAALPAARAVVQGDVSTLAGMASVAEQANTQGAFDAVIHNVGIGYREPRRIETADGLPEVFATNVLAPYVLTMRMHRPSRLVYLSSGMHHHVNARLDDLLWAQRPWSGATAYAETKLYDAMLAFAVARRWPSVRSNALEPGWVPTRMGGRNAPDDIQKAHDTQAWLAVSEAPAARVTGRYFFHMKEMRPNKAAYDASLQNQLIDRCASLSGIEPAWR